MKSEDWFKLYITNTEKRLESIEKKLDEVLKFKWHIAGGLGAVTFFTTIVFQSVFK